MRLLITAGRVITGPGGESVTDGAVLVDNGGIVAAGPREKVEELAPDGVPRRSFPGATVLPGLIDCHVHLIFDAGADPVGAVRESDDAGLLLGMAGRARRLLDTGVTTVRDLGDRNGLALRLRDAIAGGQLTGPRILTATTPLTSPGGHCWFFGGEVSGEQAIRDLVRRNVRHGADVIKVMATGGGMTPGGPPSWQSQFTADELRVIVEEAHGAGLRVAAHAHGTEGIAAAVAASVDTIEHCTWMVEGGFDMRDELVDEIVDKGIFVCTAASPNWRGVLERFGPERAQPMFDRVGELGRRGVRLISGTDAGVPRAVFDDLPGSLEFFHHLGLPLSRVVDMATVEAAEALGIAADTGRLAPGYRADVLVVDGDPLTDLAALREVRLVLAGGRPHVPERAAAAF